MPKSTYSVNATLNAFLRNTVYTPSASVYVALFGGNPASGGTEATGGSYARQAITFSVPAGGSVSNSATITFTNMPIMTISYIAIYDASTSGNLLYYAAVTANKTTNAGDTVAIATTGISITEA